MSTADLRPGTGRGRPRARPAALELPEVVYDLDLDIGEVALGYHLIALSVFLTDENLLFEYAFAPELPRTRMGKSG